MRLLIIIDLRRAAADEDQRTLNPEEHLCVQHFPAAANGWGSCP